MEERRALTGVRALRHRSFTMFWLGALVSNAGTWMQNITVPYVLLQLTHSATWVGASAFCAFLPSLLVTPIAGSIADRIPRKVFLLWSQAAQALIAFALFAAWVGHVRRPIVLVILVALGGLVYGTTLGAWHAFVSELVPREDLLNAVSLNAAQNNAARAIGPALGGLVLARYGPAGAFLLNSLSFLAVIGALALVRTAREVHHPTEQGVWRHFADGVAYARRHTGILVAITLAGTTSLLLNPVLQLSAVVARTVYHVGAGRYAWLIAAFGAAAVLGAVILGVLDGRVPRSRIALGASVAFGASMVLFALNRAYLPGLALMGTMGLCFVILFAVLNTTVQLQVREEVRGRVLAVLMMAIVGGYPFGALIEGWLADVIGVRTTLGGAAVVFLVVVAVIAADRRRFLSLDDHVDAS